ncbi:hypothetical protein BVRB_6g136310 [Beta vulgaris subsp. vulgaris]|uniref:uncharacterized protein LOC104895772 n=1 Tax=Beta vulgaris subsp. vulgaris TaxID=3555 RepID=UPI00053FEAA4|nr:uncharacterized protein LOC104895772 [Beta vulgaris subsp. vulgaris]KMT08911.1 hypothetical protein BVRB_6g136310 [Beta vulgaris subsp. vulgaris]
MRKKRLETLLKLTRSCSQKPFIFLPLKPQPIKLLNPSLSFPHHLFSLSSQHNFSAFSSQTISSVTTFSGPSNHTEEDDYETEQDLVVEEWEEEGDTEPEIGDGGAGGGIVLQNVPWGERVLSIAREVLLQFGDGIKLYSFKTTPRGYVYVRLDELANEYGCPSMDLIESYSREYKKRLEEEGSKGEIPNDLALEVSSPGAERLLRVPDDLLRFKDFPMVVSYVEETEAKCQEKSGVFFLDSIETESEHCVWKLADVRGNRDPASKGRPMSRKKKDWRWKLPYTMLKKVTLYIEF